MQKDVRAEIEAAWRWFDRKTATLPAAEPYRYDVYEPWTPTVGTRVRIRLSGECSGPGDHTLGSKASHQPDRDGITGTIKGIYSPDQLLPPRLTAPAGTPWIAVGAHRFVVAWDDREGHGGHYAAVELEPLTAAPAPTR